jgi:2TM domain
MTINSENIDRIARRRAGAKMGWLIHASVYLLVNTGLFALATFKGQYWAFFPALGWGLGLAIHGIVVWMAPMRFQIQERLIARERTRLQQEL